jgi:hypothetical protein
MKLFHFTPGGCLPSIDAGGLRPRVRTDAPMQSLGKPVVWLTSEPAPSWDFTFDPRFGPPVCIDVLLEPNTSRLAHYPTWLRNQGRSLIDIYDPAKIGDRWSAFYEAVEYWHVYFGTVPRARLVLPRYEVVS